MATANQPAKDQAVSFNVKSAPRPVGAYVHARRVGDLLFLSGIGPRCPGTDEVPGGPVVDPETGKRRNYDAALQTKQVFDNIRIILADAGASLRDVVDIQCFLIDMERDFPAFNAVYAQEMEGIAATRTTMYVCSAVHTCYADTYFNVQNGCVCAL